MKNKYHLEYTHKRRTIVALAILVLASIYLFKNASFVLRATTTALFLIFFYIADHLFDIRFRPRHYVFIIIIAFASIIFSPLYFIYPNYDKIQHFFQPILICSIMYFMIDKLSIKVRWKLTFAFFVTVAILGLFEIGEYALDYFFDMKLQGVYLRDIGGLEKFNLLVDRIDDTMIDLVLGVAGSIIYAGTKAIRLHRKSKK